ncbi:acyl-CoA N-acyltransferase [Pyronema omphalodes]|nr:acyl-CoA N-acyltransferase [Pyronema omphalodes]
MPRPMDITIRRAQLSDISAMASLGATAHLHSGLTKFLSPYVFTFVSDYIYSCERRIRRRMASARNVTFLAIDSATGNPIGYAQFLRFGCDPPALELIAQQSTWSLRVLQPIVTIREFWDSWMFKDRSVDPVAAKEWEKILEEDDYWAEYKRMWYVQSLVVSPGHQKRGVGSRLMRVVLERAEVEGVVVGLEASPEGEALYRRLGFVLLQRFKNKLGDWENEQGGVFLWEPPGYIRDN